MLDMSTVEKRVSYQEEVRNRLSKIEGQVRGVRGMLEDDKSYRDVVFQMTAIRSALDRVIGFLVAENMHNSLVEGFESGRDQWKLIEEAVNLLVKSR